MIIVSFTISKTIIIVCKYIIVLIIFNDREKSLYYYLNISNSNYYNNKSCFTSITLIIRCVYQINSFNISV
jgi:hypothetical protein